MKSNSCLVAVLTLSTLCSFAQKEATTFDGKNVLLFPNGTWSPITQEEQQNISTVKVAHLELPKTKPHDQIITHTGYSLSYNPNYHIANWVAYELTEDETNPIVKRNDHFIPDPLLQSGSASNSDYKGTGYDRGHLAPSADMCYSYQTMVESFYLSNMSPQVPSFNRGIWKRLEEQVRQWAIDDKAVFVVTGCILTNGLPTIGANRITVPRYFYKVILNYREPDIKGIGFIIPNEGSKEPLQNYAVTIDSVEKVTGTDFFYQLPDDQECIIESKIDLSVWSWTSTSTHDKGKSSNSVRCKGTTKAGAQCKNMTLNPNGYCHLHQIQASGVKPQNNSIKKTSNRRTVSVKCSATTKKGTQCSRMTYSPNGKCWQHGED